jgi:hypothetical protein
MWKGVIMNTEVFWPVDTLQHGVSCQVSEQHAVSISGEQLHLHYQEQRTGAII